ncbi:MAG TPA: class D sortase [Gemmatimonadales bacterium]
MRRLTGWLLVLCGVAVLAGAGWRYAGGLLARDRARAAWERIEARQRLLAANERVEDVATGPFAPGTPVARLLIPSIGLDEVIVEGVGGRELDSGPGHLPGTPLPGLAGNSVISAHRDMHFRRFGELAPGDTVTTITGAGRVTWRIVGRRIVGADEPALFQTPGRELTLTTCWPIRLIGPAPDRLLLSAIPLDSVVAPEPTVAAVSD